MPGFPAPFIKFREDDANGFPLAGGKLWSYAAGTNNPLPTYNNQDLAPGHENLNPTILDASGRADVWMQDGVGYKFLLTDALDNQIWTQDNVQVPRILTPSPPAEVPTGGIVMFGGTLAPTGWLLCDGSTVSRSTYSDLFGVIGVTFGAGNGATFGLPDLRQRFPLGKATSGVGVALGESGGAIDHVHTGPSHKHGMPHTHTMPHVHSAPRDGWGGTVNTPPIAGRLQSGGSGVGSEASVMQATNDATTGSPVPSDTGGVSVADTALAGTDDTGKANPPYLTLTFIIKT